MYGILRFHVGRLADPALFDYCMAVTGRSRNLRNAVLFRIRQWFTAYGKEELQPLQKEVIEEVRRTCEVTGRKLPKKVLNYFFLYSASENSKIRKREFQKMQTTFPKSAK